MHLQSKVDEAGGEAEEEAAAAEARRDTQRRKSEVAGLLLSRGARVSATDLKVTIVVFTDHPSCQFTFFTWLQAPNEDAVRVALVSV